MAADSDCPVCHGKGVWRRYWNEPYTVKYNYFPDSHLTRERYADEVCPRCIQPTVVVVANPQHQPG